MKFIKATLSDINIIKSIIDTTINSVYSHYYPRGVVEFFLNHHSRRKIEVDIKAGRVLLVKVNNMIIGTGSIHKNEVGRLFVLPEFQGLGYGTSIMGELEEIIFKEYSEVILDSSLPAYDLYIKLGYEPIKHNKTKTFNDDVLCFSTMRKYKGKK